MGFRLLCGGVGGGGWGRGGGIEAKLVKFVEGYVLC